MTLSCVWLVILLRAALLLTGATRGDEMAFLDVFQVVTLNVVKVLDLGQIKWHSAFLELFMLLRTLNKCLFFVRIQFFSKFLKVTIRHTHGILLCSFSEALVQKLDLISCISCS